LRRRRASEEVTYGCVWQAAPLQRTLEPRVGGAMRMLLTTVAIFAVIAAAAFALWPRIARADILKEGDMAPLFTTQMAVGDQLAPVSLADLRGKTVVLYFYPKDDTPGCTKEACAFRDDYTRFESSGITVLGASIDSADSHKAFIAKYKIPFGLLLDENKSIATAYGAANGIPILGLNQRITYVIGADGRIVKVYPNVDPMVHASQILKDLGADKPAAPPTPAASN
ncbi:MAG: peroxiredoxin, partial [Candidatus Binataceae bacterium]